ncbi:hypothetical protein [Dyadobacter sp. CY323]|uniref:hypothetical protein n=1 Tax=Dyadobacter sp. CY323 TaxID=2907302 RepID=UPI001F363A3D|nr:hypothetical protein [Dyadobacter sp. CY323]MCE6993061.1 hypothetical protein [Dyadobacter sp. CY323]
MKLKAVLETLDGLDEAVQAFYTEKDGKFYLSVDGLIDHPDAKSVKTALDKERQAKRDLETKVTELTDKYSGLPEDFSVDEYNRLKDSGGGDINQKLADQRARLTQEKDTAVKKAETERDSYKSRVEKLASENAINTALAEANVAPHMQKAVRAMFQSQIKVDYEGDEAIVTIENLPVVDKIKAWAGTEEGKYFVAAPANGGGGGGNNKPGTGNNDKDNPYTKEGFNLTKQAELEKSDPTKAAQLKAAAGK